MKIAESWKKSNAAEKISGIMIILLSLLILTGGVMWSFFQIRFFYYPTLPVSCLLFFSGLYNWRNNRVFAFLFWFAAISVFITAFMDAPVFYWYNF